MSLQRKLEVLSAAVVLSAAAGPAAADFGLGAAFTNGGFSTSSAFNTGTAIMVPIRLEGWLIEPQVADVSSKAFGTTTKSHEPGVGGYLRKEVGPGYEMYYGGIIGYNVTKTQVGAAAEIKSTSLILQPTIGLAHYFSKQFSVGVDVGLQYQHGTTTQSGQPDQDISRLSTVARIIGRMYF